MEACWLPAFLRKSTDKETKDRTMLIFGEDCGEGEAGKRRHGGTHSSQNPHPRADRYLGEVQGQKRGECSGTGTATQAHSAGRRNEWDEAGGWQVRATPRWAALCTRRGGGERVK